MVHLFQSTCVLMHCIPVQDNSVIYILYFTKIIIMALNGEYELNSIIPQMYLFTDFNYMQKIWSPAGPYII